MRFIYFLHGDAVPRLAIWRQIKAQQIATKRSAELIFLGSKQQRRINEEVVGDAVI
jgi:hypothetical protein